MSYPDNQVSSDDDTALGHLDLLVNATERLAAAAERIATSLEQANISNGVTE